MWELKIHMTLHLIQIYFLMNYLVESAENSICEARFCEHHLKNAILLVPHFNLRSTIPV